MIEFENRLLIHKSPEVVFAFLADFENIPMWNYYVRSVERISTQTGLNARYLQVRKNDRQEFVVCELKAAESIAIKTVAESKPAFERHFSLSFKDNKTVLTDTWKLETGKPVLLEKLFRKKIQSAVAENLEKLRQLLETGAVVLQDGRRIALES